MSTSITDQFGETTSALLCVPSMDSGADTACTELLLPAAPSELNVLWVTYTRPAQSCLDRWRRVADSDPKRLGIVTVGETNPSVEGVDSGAIEVINNPSDMTGLGIKVGEFISNQEGPTAVCFDSVTAMLQYVDIETAYEFLHALTGRLYAADAFAHFHLDPSAHDDQTVDTLLSLFDDVVRIEDGERTVTRRYPSQ
jgi:hypothetical protein